MSMVFKIRNIYKQINHSMQSEWRMQRKAIVSFTKRNKVIRLFMIKKITGRLDLKKDNIEEK